MKPIRLLAMFAALFVLVFVSYVIFLSCSDSQSPYRADQGPGSYDTEGWIEFGHPDKGDIGAPAALSSNTFSGFRRFPAEEKRWLSMVNDTAYFRDAYISGKTNIWAASDGETWTAIAVQPDGDTVKWKTCTFYSVYGDKTDCFVWPLSTPLCGGTYCWIEWIARSQCEESGDWEWSFINSGTPFHTDTCTVLPKINPSKVAFDSTFDQTRYSSPTLHHYDSLCYWQIDLSRAWLCDTFWNRPATISGMGCYLVAASMLLEYHGIPSDPLAVNAWLTNNGWFPKGELDPQGIQAYAAAHGGNLYYVGSADTTALNSAICSRGLVLAQVQRAGVNQFDHWVTVTGHDSGKTTYLIVDPEGAASIKLSDRYTTGIKLIDIYADSSYSFRNDVSWIRIKRRSPIELYLIDPEKRRSGIDPTTGQTYEDIPYSSYNERLVGDLEGDCVIGSKWLQVAHPLDGEYELVATGTDDGTYDIEVFCYSTELGTLPTAWESSEVPIETGEVHKYSIIFDKTPGALNYVGGGFSGGRQRPKDVDWFLSYITPDKTKNILTGGVTTFEMHILYGKTIYPETFKATLNGNNVADLFEPAPGGFQILTIPLETGENELILSVAGEAEDRRRSDEDILTFTVQ